MDFSKQNSSIDKKTGNSTSLAASAVKTTSQQQNVKRDGHKLELDHTRAMSMTGVVDVPVFTDKNVTVRLDGETLLVTGQNLAVKNLDVESGRLQMTGRVFSLKYTSQATPTSFFKKLLK